MAKKTNTKKKKISKPVSMVLKQNMGQNPPKTPKQKNRVYEAFKKRCKTKSDHAYVDAGETPELLRLFLKGTKFDSTVEFLVKFGSFKLIKAKTGKNKGKEIGFKVKLKSPLISKSITLEVFLEQFKASLIILN